MCVMLSVCRASERVWHNQGPFASLVTLPLRSKCKEPIHEHAKAAEVDLPLVPPYWFKELPSPPWSMPPRSSSNSHASTNPHQLDPPRFSSICRFLLVVVIYQLDSGKDSHDRYGWSFLGGDVDTMICIQNPMLQGATEGGGMRTQMLNWKE